MERKGVAIVLKVIPRGEDDLLSDLFTEDWGRFWAVARSGRKSRKRFGTTLAPLNVLNITYEERPRSSWAFLKETSMAIPLSHLSSDLTRLGTAFYMAEAVREMTPEPSSEPLKFRLLLTGLIRLNQGEDPRTLREGFGRDLLKLAGFEPHLEGCLRCGSRQERYFFVFQEGGLFCEGCLPSGRAFQPVKAGHLEPIFTPFLEYCIGKRLRSKALCLP